MLNLDLAGSMGQIIPTHFAVAVKFGLIRWFNAIMSTEFELLNSSWLLKNCLLSFALNLSNSHEDE